MRELTIERTGTRLMGSGDADAARPEVGTAPGTCDYAKNCFRAHRFVVIAAVVVVSDGDGL
jgi:hypothetical protein